MAALKCASNPECEYWNVIELSAHSANEICAQLFENIDLAEDHSFCSCLFWNTTCLNACENLLRGIAPLSRQFSVWNSSHKQLMGDKNKIKTKSRDEKIFPERKEKKKPKFTTKRLSTEDFGQTMYFIIHFGLNNLSFGWLIESINVHSVDCAHTNKIHSHSTPIWPICCASVGFPFCVVVNFAFVNALFMHTKIERLVCFHFYLCT